MHGILLAIVGCSTVNIGQVDETISAEVSSVSVVETSGRVGQLYSRALRQAFYLNGQALAAYELKSSISVSTSSTLSVEVSSTFRKMTVIANFELTKQGSGDVLLQDTVKADATLGTVSSLFGQDQSEQHARDNGYINCSTRRSTHPTMFLKNTDN